MSFKSIELFAGAGGLALGLEKAGFETILISDNDKNCIQTLKNPISLFVGLMYGIPNRFNSFPCWCRCITEYNFYVQLSTLDHVN